MSQHERGALRAVPGPAETCQWEQFMLFSEMSCSHKSPQGHRRKPGGQGSVEAPPPSALEHCSISRPFPVHPGRPLQISYVQIKVPSHTLSHC